MRNSRKLSASQPTQAQREWADDEIQLLTAKFPLKRPLLLCWASYRTTAGMADFRQNAILLGAAVCKTEVDIRATVRHEYAHLLAFDRAGRKGTGHGPVWRQAMHDLGEPPTVKHRLDCNRNVPRQIVTYTCQKCGAKIERRRRLPKSRIYYHLGCSGRIVLEEIRAQ